MKKAISILLVLSVLFVLGACKKDNADETTADTTVEITTTVPVTEVTTLPATTVADTTAEQTTQVPTTVAPVSDPTTAVDTTPATTEAPTEAPTEASTSAPTEQEVFPNGVVKFDYSKVDADPSKWTMQQIVDCYKSGMTMEDHADVQTDQSFELIGDLPGGAAILKKPIQLAMKLAAQPFGALPGGYWNLEVADLKSADAHKEGDYVVINLYPNVQVDGPNGNEHEGCVGHVVNVVQGIDGFIGYVEENFSALNAKYDEDSVVLTYNNAYAKNVKINTQTGKMESGTWGYDIDVFIDHASMAGVQFNNFNTTIRWNCWYPVA